VRAYALEADQDPFHALRGLFAKAVQWLGGHESAGLAHGDLEVRASLALSYQALAPAQQRAFRLLGLAPAPDFAAWAASALLT